MKVSVIVVAGGRGLRAGGAVPKQFASLAGRTMFLHAVDAALGHASVDNVILVVPADREEEAGSLLGTREVAVVPGGQERHLSVHAGLVAASATGATHVLIHDAARPHLPFCVIDRLLEALASADGAVPALPVADTLAHQDDDILGEVVDRSLLWRVQTPQAFRLDAIMTSHLRWDGGNPTDDAQMARAAGFKIVMVEGDVRLEKITQPADFALAEQRLAVRMSTRTGQGFDVHRLELGRPLWLAGVRIEHDRGLAGHSDADVALHALVDALLGAICEGDIGTHFPPSDPKWKGAESWRFVDHARSLIESRGGIIEHVDLTLVCEAPKIGPHRSAMRERIAELLAIGVSRVSVKATTTEGLGFAGRGEGIAAHALATVRVWE